MFRLHQWNRLAALCCVLASCACLHAQATRAATDHIDSRVDVYGGYGYFHPIHSGINGYQYQDVSNLNTTVSVTGYFNRYIGVQMEGGYFSGSGEHRLYDSVPGGGCAGESCDQLVYTAEAGPVFRLPLGPFVPYLHLLGGGAKINGPVAQPLFWGFGVTGGFGLDYVMPPFNHRLAVRLFQADFQYSQVVYGPQDVPNGTHSGFGEIDALKLSGGLVVRFGDARGAAPVMLGCTAEPVSAYPGEPITINGKTVNANTKKHATYTWASNGGGKLVPSGTFATIDTTGATAGEYTATGHYQEGMKAREQSTCTAPFTIKKYDPPTLTCSATPSTATSGTTIDISTAGFSPQNRPLTYSYTTTAGEITSAGPTAKLVTAGLSPSTIKVTCSVADDQGQVITATADVVLSAPPIPVVPQTQALCSLSFERDKRRPARVDNEAKGCLDDIALTLNQQTDARLVIVGNAAPGEESQAAAARTLNARQYLTKEKGIDPSRIELRVGDITGKTISDTLIPAGAIYNDIATHTFDEGTVIRHGQAYGIPRVKKGAKLKKKTAPEPAAVQPTVPGADLNPPPSSTPEAAPVPVVPSAVVPASVNPATTAPAPVTPPAPATTEAPQVATPPPATSPN